jgi:hypothetical protein
VHVYLTARSVITSSFFSSTHIFNTLNRTILIKKSIEDLKNWKPSCREFEQVVETIISTYATTSVPHDAIEAGDDVLGHSILFIWDGLFFLEFCDAICNADVGKMWLVYDFWVFIMRGQAVITTAMKSLK